MQFYRLIETVLRSKSGGDEVKQEYQATNTMKDATRRQMVNILMAHMIDSHGMNFFDAASGAGYISWRLKTVQRKIRRGSPTPPNRLTDSSSGGPNLQRTVNVIHQLDGDACKEAMSLLNHTTDNSVILQKMKETFQHHQRLVNDPGRSVEQDFTLLFDDDRLLQKWKTFFRPNVIKEGKKLTSTPELLHFSQQKVIKKIIKMILQPLNKKWHNCWCCYISFHHQEDKGLQKSVQVMQVRDL
ncbi:uncharacterized protein LOC102075687 isoform X2 [Oreochromis niloticus]|uniref:uncharacterized protein LOC102075687 isoform X2 n=1 Tax=Oreochromis niloticus TaxID=8128 RepID=UPI000DF4BC33|nr:uncharacterized protein LOC102075687 isoform X2 [Oreochromis niloticus]